MKLPLRFGKKKEEKQYFLALVLRNEKVNAVFFEEELSKVKVLARHSEYFENSCGPPGARTKTLELPNDAPGPRAA